MDDKTLYAQLLGLLPPWGVEKVELKLAEGDVHVWVALPAKEPSVRPECLVRAPIRDHRERTWRHLDTFPYRTILRARIPRLKCPNHGVKQPPEQLASILAVAMDMWEPDITSTCNHLPDARKKIVFDKFHIAQHLAPAVDLVRRRGHRELLAQGQSTLKGTKDLWRRNPESDSLSQWRTFRALLRTVPLKTARAWALKEDFMNVWDHTYPGAAERRFRSWYPWAGRSRLEPMREVAAMIRRHWDHVKTYFRHRIANAGSESIHSKVQRLRAMARGFRDPERFRMAIYFHCGGLDRYPGRAPVTR